MKRLAIMALASSGINFCEGASRQKRELASLDARNEMKRYIIDDLKDNPGYDSTTIMLRQGLVDYLVTKGDEAIPVQIPDWMWQWYMQKIGRSVCYEDCDAGFMDMSPLFGYGCWCFFGDIDSQKGRGQPVDAYDEICKDLLQCYRCAMTDGTNEGAECDPFEQEYKTSIETGGNNGIDNATSSCQAHNPDACSWRTCSCAMMMVARFFQLTFDINSIYDHSLKHDNGFEYDVQCPITPHMNVNKQCCGHYPFRRIYDHGDSRHCCNEKTIYNPMRHQCCDDGSRTGLAGMCRSK